MNDTLSITEVSEMLKITDKTVRNYIKRGFLNPEKWNGMWRISRQEVLEIYKKKNGNNKVLDKSSAVPGIEVPQGEYLEQMIGLGKLQAYERLLGEQKEELLKAMDRIIQLEASSAAGWTEARSAQSQCESLRKDIAEMRRNQSTISEELAWVRRENERVVRQLEDQIALDKKRCLRIKTLEDQLHASSLFG